MKRDRKKLRLDVKTIRHLDARDLAAVIGGSGTKDCAPTDGCRGTR